MIDDIIRRSTLLFHLLQNSSFFSLGRIGTFSQYFIRWKLLRILREIKLLSAVGLGIGLGMITVKLITNSCLYIYIYIYIYI